MDLKRHSKRLSWLLRHGARESGLEMDEAGFAAISDVIVAAGIDRATLLRVVEGNDKQRLQIAGDKIRATQGHSLAGTPVTLEGLEASWTRIDGRTEALWHGTRRASLPAIRAQGILPMDRSHVHLAGARDARTGKREGVEVMLRVDPACLEASGLSLYQSPNGVFLVRYVPPSCVAS